MQQKIARYSKAIMAILGAGATVLGMWGVNTGLTAEQGAAIAGAAATLLVIFGPKNAE